MTDLISRLAEIREQAGYDALPDPTKIEGFGPQDPPPVERPPVDLSQVPEGPPEPDFDDEVFEDESPLIPKAVADEFRQQPQIPGNFQPAQPLMPKPDFAIVGMDGTGVYLVEYLGRQVQLSDSEKARAQTLARAAISRALRAELAELRPKRKRRARGMNERSEGAKPAPASEPSPPPKRQRRARLDGAVR